MFTNDIYLCVIFYQWIWRCHAGFQQLILSCKLGVKSTRSRAFLGSKSHYRGRWQQALGSASLPCGQVWLKSWRCFWSCRGLVRELSVCVSSDCLLRLSCLWAVGAFVFLWLVPCPICLVIALLYPAVVLCVENCGENSILFLMHRANLNGGSLSSVKKSYLKDVSCYLFQIVLSHLSRSHRCYLWWLCVLVGFLPIWQQAWTVCTRLLSLLIVKENPWSSSSELSLCIWPQLSFFIDLVFKEISWSDAGSAGSKKKFRCL